MIYYFCPDDQTPTGGIKVLYRHVDILNKAGIDAVIVHEKAGFRATWFDNDTPVTSREEVTLHRQGIAVLPEVYGPDATDYARDLRKVIFNQSGSLTFNGYPADGAPSRSPYAAGEIEACMTISDRVTRYVEHVFPSMPVFRVSWSVDSKLFRPEGEKAMQIAYMPRKHPDEAREVFNILRHRGVLGEYRVVALDQMSEREVAHTLGESLFFFSFGYPEGLPLPPAEAMSSACLVVGYHGWGGEEFFFDDVCHAVPNGDVLAFAQIAERVLTEAVSDKALAQRRGQAARGRIASLYSRTRETERVLAAWAAIGQRGGPRVARGD